MHVGSITLPSLSSTLKDYTPSLSSDSFTNEDYGDDDNDDAREEKLDSVIELVLIKRGEVKANEKALARSRDELDVLMKRLRMLRRERGTGVEIVRVSDGDEGNKEQ